MRADNKTIYTFCNTFIFSNANDTVMFFYDGSDRIGTFGHDDNGQLFVGSDTVAMRVNLSDSLVVLNNTASDTFHVSFAGNDYLTLDNNSNLFYISNSSNPYIVRYVNDPVIDIDAANKRYVDDKVPSSIFTLTGTSTAAVQGSSVMMIKGTNSSFIIPESLVSGSNAHQVEISLLIKGTGSSTGLISSQTYILGACTGVDHVLTLGNANMRALVNNYISALDYNIVVVATSDYFQLYFNYANSPDTFMAEAYLKLYSL